MDPSSTEPNDSLPARVDRAEIVVARVTEREDGQKACTIAPLPTSERILQSEWVTALGDSFVTLEEMQ